MVVGGLVVVVVGGLVVVVVVVVVVALTVTLVVAELVVYVNGQDLTSAFRAEGNSFQRTDGELIVRRTNDTLRASFQEGGSPESPG